MARAAVRGGDLIAVAAAAALAGLVVSSLNADIMNFRFVWVLAGTLRGLQGSGIRDQGSGRVRLKHWRRGDRTGASLCS
jgi:hypothetical protein